MTNFFLHDIIDKAEQLHSSGDLERAAELYHHILNINPFLSRTAYNLGLILIQLQDYSGAETAFRTCLTSEPNLLEARLNLAFALQEQGNIPEAYSRYQAILSTDPGCLTARFNLACLQLLQGNFEDGLPGYELRFTTNDPVRNRHQELPVWPGIIRPGLRLLVYAEQGYGDTIMMLRYLPLLTAQGVKVVLEVQPPLVDLCCQLAGVHCIERDTPLPTVDYRLPIMSLPLATKTSLDFIPAATPYLKPAPELVQRWKRRLDDTKLLRVGLAWSGRMDLPVNRKRSCPPNVLQTLLDNDRVSFISLQNTTDEDFQLIDHRLQNYSSELTDFHQTAALLANLDLVITIDTAVAHLAGVLGIPTWLMLPAVPDWRWLLDRIDSPWYPSMRLFRQPSPIGWESVIEMIKTDLDRICRPRIWCYHDGRDFDNSLTSTRPTPLTDRSRWPELGIREAEAPNCADWLMFPYYLENIAEFQTIAGMWCFLEQLPNFSAYQEQHLLFSDHDSEAPYHSSAVWFRASINPDRHDPHAFTLPYQVSVPDTCIHFDQSKIRFHISFVGYLGQQRERVPFINGVIAESRLVHELDLTTSFHLHQTEQIREERRKRYLEVSSASICVLCPRGEGSSSQRFFETLALGRIPVILEPMPLPFTDRIDYTRFVISIPKDKTDQAGTIVFNWLTSLSDEELMQRCREARGTWIKHLAPEATPEGIVRLICRNALSSPASPSKQQETSAGNWQHQLNEGATLLLEGRLLEARQLLANALILNPRSALIHVTMGGIEQELGGDSSAELHLRDAILYDHRCYDAYLLLGGLLARTGRPVEAIGRYYQASLLKPDESAPYQLALPLMQQQGRLDDAEFCRKRLLLLTASGNVT